MPMQKRSNELHLSFSGEWGTTKHLSWSNGHEFRLSFDKVARGRGSAPNFEVLRALLRVPIPSLFII